VVSLSVEFTTVEFSVFLFLFAGAILITLPRVCWVALLFYDGSILRVGKRWVRWAVQFLQIRNYNFTGGDFVLLEYLSGTFISSDIFFGHLRFASTAEFSMVDIKVPEGSSVTWGVMLLVRKRWGALSRSILADPKLQLLLAVTNGGIGIIFDFVLVRVTFPALSSPPIILAAVVDLIP